MLENLRKQLSALLDERAASQASIDAIVAACDDEARTELTSDEQAAFNEARAALGSLDERIAKAESDISDLVALDEARAKAEAIVVPKSTAKGGAVVRAEERTYRADQFGADAFLADAYNVHFRRGLDLRDAEDRLARSQREAMDSFELRATTGAFGGLVVPQYLTAEFAPVLVSGRPFINAINRLPLPADGMTMTIPRGNTGTGVAAQANQGSAVQNTTYGVSDLTVNVNTYAGQNVFSRQAFERGTGIGTIVLQDLYQQYATKTNVDALGGAGTSGTHLGAFAITNNVTSVAFSGTGAQQGLFIQKVLKAIGLVNERRYMPADLIVMHPRRWAWTIGGLDSSNRPLVDITGSGFNAFGAGDAAGYGFVGSIAGVPVLTDAGVSTAYATTTNEDRVLVTRRSDHYFWEQPGAPVGLTFEEVLGSNLQVQVVAYGFSAYTGERYPQAIATVTNGLSWLL